MTVPLSDPNQHYVTATTHLIFDTSPVSQAVHYLTLHCYCGNSAGADGGDPHEVFNDCLAKLHPSP